MYLAVDIGNTNIKLGVFDRHKLVDKYKDKRENTENLIGFIRQFELSKAIVSSVTHATEFEKELAVFCEVMALDENTLLPLEVRYESPQTLGRDRIAVAVAADRLFPGKELLVVDSGTCITYDLIERGKYMGGSISPGIKMRFKALNNFTGRLPLVEYENSIPLLTGDNTVNSILSGVVNGARAEFKGLIEQYLEKYPQLQVIITGGDMQLFDLELKNHIFADTDLLLKGLNEILFWNETNRE